jgi:hypothetical protein
MVTISAEETLTSGISTLTLNESAGFASTIATTDTLRLTKKQDFAIEAPGGLTDGVNHDRDAIWLWLNPTVAFQVCGSHADWTLTTQSNESTSIHPAPVDRLAKRCSIV